jgi:cytochrome c biogenesis factor
MVPLMGWIINSVSLKTRFFIRKPLNLSAVISHVGVIFLMFGAITSVALAEHGGFVVRKNEKYIEVSNSKIEISDLSVQSNLIIHNGVSDIILSPADKSTVSSNLDISNMVVYKTRPFILMFWLGGALVMFGTFGSIVRIIFFKYDLE